jgi:hypothetical protein
MFLLPAGTCRSISSELPGSETAFPGFSAAPQRFADYSTEDVTLQARLLHPSLTEITT